MLCLGTDLHHKNRLFVLRMLERLKARHAWDGMLVFAGPTIRHGSSRPRETLLLDAHPGLAASVLDVGSVSEAEKAWLYGRSALVVYPSVVEGFGLVPFEAAAYRVPSMWAPESSLREMLPEAAAEIIPWDPEQSAARALALMRQADARERNLSGCGRGRVRPDLGRDRGLALGGLQDDRRGTCQPWPHAPPAAGWRWARSARMPPVWSGPHGELPANLHRPVASAGHSSPPCRAGFRRASSWATEPHIEPRRRRHR